MGQFRPGPPHHRRYRRLPGSRRRRCGGEQGGGSPIRTTARGRPPDQHSGEREIRSMTMNAFPLMLPLRVHAVEAVRPEDELRYNSMPYESSVPAGRVDALKTFLVDYPGHRNESDALAEIRPLCDQVVLSQDALTPDRGVDRGSPGRRGSPGPRSPSHLAWRDWSRSRFPSGQASDPSTHNLGM